MWLRCLRIYVALMSVAEAEKELWAHGFVPTNHHLRAALRVRNLLENQATIAEGLHGAYPHLPSDGIFGSRDFYIGERILIACGVARLVKGRILIEDKAEELEREDEVACELLLAQYLGEVQPPWLAGATREARVNPQLVPDSAGTSLATTIGDPSRREAFLLALGEKFDRQAREVVGDAGERAVVEACRESLVSAGRRDLAAQVRQVSRRSDYLGYDVVTPNLVGEVLRLEIKSTRARGARVTVFVSRGEANVAERDQQWRLVVCRLHSEDRVEILGWLPGRALAGQFPADAYQGARWASAILELGEDRLNPGLPLRPGASAES